MVADCRSAVSAAEVPRVAEAVAQLLRVRHKIAPGEPDDFMVRTLEEMASVRTEATRTMTMLLAGIAGVSLLVAESNVMTAAKVADRLYVIDRGEIIFSGTPDQALAADDVMRTIRG